MPNLIRITDPADPRIAAYCHVRERDLVGRDDHFIAEGEVVLRTLLESERHQPVSLLIDEKRVDGLGNITGRLAEDVPVYVASQAVLDGIVGFHIHRGILALGHRAPAPTADALLAGLSGRALVVVLMGIANHDNLGGIFRNAAAFGADAILLDAHCCDPFYRKAIRVSVGNTLTLPHAKLEPAEDVVALLERHGFTAVSLSPNGAFRLAELKRPARVAVLLGTEGPGLDAAVLARTLTVRIPMAAGVDSLNVATTSGIVLHQLTQAAVDEEPA
ncbi:TrmH family RNA methyltransferase [Kaistia nematophila]|uniref:RNA methyltransferase n=1 Tax=Kaistia nematophila TaxID=2994654 RepID=A0A9X3E5A2_9HYPH|nr:RNA methyltransferase [Kaistia nematophila]MCX5571403.1 RNA methyltransferase [Kaistia nematophila]